MSVLEGIRVIEWGEFVSAPFCGRLLAGLGAEVIKVERPGSGDEARHHGPFPNGVPNPEASGLFLHLNVGKRSVALDPALPEGRDLLRQLLADADVLLTNYRPSAVEGMGFAPQDLLAINPRLIVTTVTPYGWTGPYRDLAGYDITVLALAGVSFSVGEPEREPLAPPYFMGDYQAGLTASSATVTALLARDSTGRGQHVDIAAFEPWATYHAGAAVTTFVYQGVTGHRAGRRRPDLYPYTLLPCKDGLLCLIAREGRQWKRFLLDVMQREDLANHERYRDRRTVAEQYPEEMDALLAPWLMERTREEIFELCRRGRAPFAPVRRIDEALGDPHLAARGFFRQLGHPVAGPLPYAGAPFQMSDAPWRMDRAAPTLGEANEDIYCGLLGCDAGRLEELRLAGVI